MTFYEAAVQILSREGKPLHAREITEIAIRENLLSHIGKQPEQTMASRLAAMARQSHDQRLVAVEADTFGLVDWNLPADPAALEQSGLPEVHDELEPPLRPKERHPRVSKENVRVAGRGDRRHPREERELRKKKRLPPLPELVYDILERLGRGAPLLDLLSAAREKELIGEELGAEAVAGALAAENERREAEGRKAVFVVEDGQVSIRGRAQISSDEEIEVSLAKAVARVVSDRRAAPPPAPRRAAAPVAALSGPMAQAVAEQRQRTVRQLRRRLSELDAAGLEGISLSMLAAMGYQDVRVARRLREGALLVARRRMGLCDVRWAIRVVRGGKEVRREDVADLRRELGPAGAQIGVIISPADVTRDAKAEATLPGQGLVLLLCADALCEQLVEKGIGVTTRTVTIVELDDSGLRSARAVEARPEERGAGSGGAQGTAGSEEEGRESRDERRERRDKERREWREQRDRERTERRAAAAAAQAQRFWGEAGVAPAPIALTEVIAHEPGTSEPPERSEAAVSTSAVEESAGGSEQS